MCNCGCDAQQMWTNNAETMSSDGVQRGPTKTVATRARSALTSLLVVRQTAYRGNVSIQLLGGTRGRSIRATFRRVLPPRATEQAVVA